MSITSREFYHAARAAQLHANGALDVKPDHRGAAIRRLRQIAGQLSGQRSKVQLVDTGNGTTAQLSEAAANLVSAIKGLANSLELKQATDTALRRRLMQIPERGRQTLAQRLEKPIAAIADMVNAYDQRRLLTPTRSQARDLSRLWRSSRAAAGGGSTDPVTRSREEMVSRIVDAFRELYETWTDINRFTRDDLEALIADVFEGPVRELIEAAIDVGYMEPDSDTSSGASSSTSSDSGSIDGNRILAALRGEFRLSASHRYDHDAWLRDDAIRRELIGGSSASSGSSDPETTADQDKSDTATASEARSSGSGGPSSSEHSSGSKESSDGTNAGNAATRSDSGHVGHADENDATEDDQSIAEAWDAEEDDGASAAVSFGRAEAEALRLRQMMEQATAPGTPPHLQTREGQPPIEEVDGAPVLPVAGFAEQADYDPPGYVTATEARRRNLVGTQYDVAPIGHGANTCGLAGLIATIAVSPALQNQLQDHPAQSIQDLLTLAKRITRPRMVGMIDVDLGRAVSGEQVDKLFGSLQADHIIPADVALGAGFDAGVLLSDIIGASPKSFITVQPQAMPTPLPQTRAGLPVKVSVLSSLPDPLPVNDDAFAGVEGTMPHKWDSQSPVLVVVQNPVHQQTPTGGKAVPAMVNSIKESVSINDSGQRHHFELNSVVVSTPSSGGSVHYITYIRLPNTNQWHRMDDVSNGNRGEATLITVDEVVGAVHQTGAAALYVYGRVDQPIAVGVIEDG